jgi:hypothetical protein
MNEFSNLVGCFEKKPSIVLETSDIFAAPVFFDATVAAFALTRAHGMTGAARQWYPAKIGLAAFTLSGPFWGHDSSV